MKVLVVHNAYRQAGGEDVVFDAECALLREAGAEVIELRADNDSIDANPGFGAALSAIWSRSSHRRIRELIERERPDLCHFHNTFPLISPSGYYACRAARVPVVQTLHNYRLLCPASTLYRDGHCCEDCLGKVAPWPGVVHACYRNSRAATAAAGAVVFSHRLAGTWSRQIDMYVTPSEFARQLFIRAGIPEDRIVSKPNFLPLDPGVGAHRAGYALFVGRLTPEKGIETLAEAWRTIGARMPLVVAGTGELESRLRGVPGIRCLGHQTREQVFALMKDARLLVFPSVWYETFGLTIIEAFATGLPVLASRLGTATELIEDGVTGLHFAPADPADLARQIEWASAHETELAAIGMRGRLAFESRYTASVNRDALFSVYRRAMARRAGTPSAT